jgi:IclR family pca regulon transcriptional regulator
MAINKTPRTAPEPIGANAEHSATPANVDERLFVASVEKGMRILRVFDGQRPWLGLTDIVELTGLGRSAAQRFVYTLHQLGYLRRDPGTRRYGLATRVLELAKGMLDGNRLLERSQPLLAELARSTGETVSWIELDDDEIVVVANIPSVHVAHVNLPVGSRFDALTSSSGQVLLHDAEPGQIEKLFGALAPTSRKRLGPGGLGAVLKLLAQARDSGYAMTEKLMDQHGVSLSAPVRDVRGQVVAAINISTLTSRHDAASAQRDLLPLLLTTTRSASV